MKGINLGVIFLMELAVLAATGLWGYTFRPQLIWRLLLGLGGPAVLIVLWGMFGAPTASHKLHGAARVVFELGWFGTGVVALAAAGYLTRAVAFAVIGIVSKTLAVVWHQ
ncbi:MAG: YrdB family protein [Streptomycetaceae bacterium]|nr:YrdB family protein [Streptomycetaceae bacterium]NUS56652.1 YrdB family protein [Streptomycetaceae bacterium]